MSLRDEFREKIDIVELISQYVDLKRVGRNFRGLCPFHTEKTPSFYVSPEKGIFHCFGCGKGGDVITFYMEYHGLDFFEAVKELGERYGIEVNFRERGGEDLFRVNEEALNFFRMFMNTQDGKIAREYLEGRGFYREIWERWDIGFAPEGPDSLYRYLKGKGLEKAGFEAGLLMEGKRGPIDVFRNRVMFPIRDYRGRVVGFAGRTLGSDDAKYINTRNTKIFNKSKVLYGIDKAIKSMRDKNEVLVVEGYLDVIRMHESGYENTVATCGTSLTVDHLQFLKRYVERCITIFDGDEAGYRASLRALSIGLEMDMIPYVVFLPEGEDPDTMLLSGREKFEELILSPISGFEVLKRDIRKRFDLSSVDGKVKAVEEVKLYLEKVSDPVKRDIYSRELSTALGIPQGFLLDGVRRDRDKVRVSTTSYPREEILILCEVFRNPSLSDKLPKLLPFFENDTLRDIGYAFVEGGDFQEVIDNLEDESVKRSFYSFIFLESDSDPYKVIADCEKKLREKYVRRRMREILDDIRKAEEEGNTELLKKLLIKKENLRKEMLGGDGI